MLYTIRNSPHFWDIRVDVLDNLLVGDATILIDPYTDYSVVWQVDWPNVRGIVANGHARINVLFHDERYKVKEFSDKLGRNFNELSIILDELDNQEEE